MSQDISRKKQKTDQWEEIKKRNTRIEVNSNYVSINENKILRKLEKPKILEMTLKDMIQISERYKLLGKKHEIYKNLNYLRKLRNRIHLQLIKGEYDNDWHKFQSNEIRIMKDTLHLFLTSSLFKPTLIEKKIFDFLII